MTSENRNKAYIRYEDPATKNKIVLELCCVEIERLPSTVEEFDARECELDCCEQQFFGTFKTSVNQQTGEFVKKSQPSVPDKKKDDSSTPDKPSVDTPTKPSENNGNSGSTTPTTPSENTGNTTPSQPSENTGTDNGNVSPNKPSDNNGNSGTNPSAPSENNGSTDSGNTTPSNPSENGGSAGDTDSGDVTPTTPSENTGGTDNGNTGTTEPTTPSDNGNTGNTDNGNSGNTDSGNTTPTQPSENGNTGNTDSGNSGETQPTEEPTVLNKLTFKTSAGGNDNLFELNIRGKVGETVRLGDVIAKEFGNDVNGGKINSDGNFVKDGIEYTSESIKPNLRDYVYTIKENGHSEETELNQTKVNGSETGSTDKPSDNGNTVTDTGNTPSENSGTTTQPDAPIVRNFIELNDISDIQEGEETNIILTLPVHGKIGDKIRLGDEFSKYTDEQRNHIYPNKDGNLTRDEDGVIYTLVDSHSSISDYVYTIKEEGHEEVIPVKEKRL